MWYQKTLAAFEEIDLPSSKKFQEELFESTLVQRSACPILLMLGQHQHNFKLLSAIGFTWGKEGFENFDAAYNELRAVQTFYDHKCEPIFSRLLIFLSVTDGAIDEAEVSAWIPSPTELAEMEKSYPAIRWLYACTWSSSLQSLNFNHALTSIPMAIYCGL